MSRREDLATASLELRFTLLRPRVFQLTGTPIPDEFAVWRFGISLALFADAGTTWFRGESSLPESFLSGYGGGIHFLLPYGIVARIEYAFNNYGKGSSSLTSAPLLTRFPVPPHGLEYFYTPPELVNPPVLQIEAEEFTHLSHVMRRREGDLIGVVDGAGMAYVARLEKMQKHFARCTILSTFPGLHEPSRNLTVAMGVLKNPSRTDTLVEN